MPIQVKCDKCGKGLKAPDTMAGKKAKCPGCGAILVVPAGEEEILDAEIIEPTTPAPASSADPYGLGSMIDDELAYRVQEPDPTPPQESRSPCPACGEMIVTGAAKCRYCGEIFDSTLKKKAKKKQASEADQDLTSGEWVFTVLCSGLACIAGIIYVIQGKRKGWKMLGVSLLVQMVLGVARAIIEEATKK